MRFKRQTFIYSFKVKNPLGITHIELEVVYAKGGVNILTSKPNQPGIYLSIAPTYHNQTHFVTKFWSKQEKIFLEKATRLNRKRLDALLKEVVEQIKQEKPGKVLDIFKKICQDNKIEIER